MPKIKISYMKFSGFDVTQINLALESGPHSPGLHGLLLTFLHEGGSKKRSWIYCKSYIQ